MNVYRLDECQAHITVKATDGRMHVLPVSLVAEMVSGAQPLSALPETVVRSMLADFLADARERAYGGRGAR